MSSRPTSTTPTDAELLLARTRAGLWLTLACIGFFALVDVGIPAERLRAAYTLKATHGLLVLALLAVLRCRPTPAVVWGVALFSVNTTYALFALGDVVKGHEATAPLLCLTCSMAAAALLPWGLAAQVTTATFTSLGNVAVQRLTGSTWSVLLDPAASMLAAQGVAVYVVFELERFRHERRRVEAELANRARTETLRAEVRMALSEPVPSDERLARCVQTIATHLDVPVVGLLTIDGRRPLRLRAATGLAEPEHPALVRLASRVLATHGHENGVPRVLTTSSTDVGSVGPRGLEILTLYPLAAGGRTTGLLVLLTSTPMAKATREAACAVADALGSGIASVRTEEAKAQLLAELERANQVKTEFVSTMSHELRTPLNVIMGYADMLGDPDCSDPSFALGRIRQANHELLELIEATLDLNRLEAGRDEPTYASVALDDLWRELAAEFGPAAHRATLRLDFAGDRRLTVRTDRRKLKTIVKNLVGNAMKFTVRGHVTVRAEQVGAHCVVSVQDSGIGIPADALPHIFDMFRQVDSSDRRSYGGVGLGLHIVQRLCTQLGADVTVTSEVGRGTTFTVRLPLAPRVVCAA